MDKIQKYASYCRNYYYGSFKFTFEMQYYVIHADNTAWPNFPSKSDPSSLGSYITWKTINSCWWTTESNNFRSTRELLIEIDVIQK